MEDELLLTPWHELSPGQIGMVAERVFAVVQDSFEDLNGKREDLEMWVAAGFLGEIGGTVESPRSVDTLVATTLLRKRYAANLARHAELSAEVMLAEAEAPEAFCQRVQSLALSSRCSPSHPIFQFLRDEADFESLSKVLWSENLCDLNFVNILVYLLFGLNGPEGKEISENFFDEIGRGDFTQAHAKLRRDMMQNIGLDLSQERELSGKYLREEFEHFNAYFVNGSERSLNGRLIGMLFATEFLVPRQLDAVVAGWRRVGLADGQMVYLLSHVVGDVEHGEGWARRVISPMVRGNLHLQREMLIGAQQHIEILTRLYDRLLILLTGKT